MGIIKSLPLGCKPDSPTSSIKFGANAVRLPAVKVPGQSFPMEWNKFSDPFSPPHPLRQKLLKHLQIRIFSFRQISWYSFSHPFSAPSDNPSLPYSFSHTPSVLKSLFFATLFYIILSAVTSSLKKTFQLL